mgnify:CR=1 FL=1
MIEALKNIGFVVTERLERKELSSDLQNRYSELPADYQEFLQRFQTITNESDNVWFNSIEDFNGESDSGFRWNEFELMGLEALADDKESCDMIRLFWDSHIPILMSVKDGYQLFVHRFILRKITVKSIMELNLNLKIRQNLFAIALIIYWKCCLPMKRTIY